MKPTFAGVVALPALVLVLLTACTPPPTPEEREANENPSGEVGTGPSGNEISECLVGKWNLDVADLAAQLLAHLQGSGSPVTTATGEGFELIEFTNAGLVGVDTNVTYTMVAPLEDGLVMTVVQQQKGLSGGAYAVENDEPGGVVFSDWDTEVIVTNEAFINDQSTGQQPFPIPADNFGEGETIVNCDADALTILTVGSFATHTYLRVTD
jgi:hypothetical protein